MLYGIIAYILDNKKTRVTNISANLQDTVEGIKIQKKNQHSSILSHSKISDNSKNVISKKKFFEIINNCKKIK